MPQYNRFYKQSHFVDMFTYYNSIQSMCVIKSYNFYFVL